MKFSPDPKPEKKLKEKKPLKRTALKKTYKKTGEAELFSELWNERLHACTKCGKEITEPNVGNFHHIKFKSHYPELRLDKNNIQILCFVCHFAIHNK